MAAPPIDLSVEDDFRFQRRAWIAERIGWFLMAAMLLAAIAGVFGRGPLSQAEAKSPDATLTLNYERCVRLHAPTELRLSLRPLADQQKTVVSFPLTYWNSLSLVENRPAPTATRLTDDQVVYEFAVAGAQPTEIRFRVQPEHAGQQVAFLTANGRVVTFRQFVLP